MTLADDRMLTWPRFVDQTLADIRASYAAGVEPCQERPGPWSSWVVDVLDPENVWGGMATARREEEAA